MQRIKTTVAALLLGAVALFAQPEIGGMVRNYTALKLDEDLEFTQLQNTFRLDFEQRGSDGAFLSRIYAYQYGSDFTPEIEVKELFADLYFKNIDLRLGRQQIIWGKADGVFITDVVSPKDLREFLLPEFAEIRQGVDAINTSFYGGNHTLSFVFSPSFRPTVEPEPGSIWRPAVKLPTRNVRQDLSRKEVPATVGNSELFFRWSAMLSAIDFEIVGAWMWDDDPALHLTKFGGPTENGFKIDSIVVTPEHHRLAMGGGSFSTSLGGLVLKGEAGYYHGKQFRTSDPKVSDNITEGNYVHYMAGASYTLAGVDIHGQYIQKALLDHNDHYLEDQFQNMVTLLLHKSLLREKMHLEFFSYIGLDQPDALLRPSLSYEVSDGIKATFGANIFLGDEGFFGQFNDNNMLYTKLSYSF